LPRIGDDTLVAKGVPDWHFLRKILNKMMLIDIIGRSNSLMTIF